MESVMSHERPHLTTHRFTPEDLPAFADFTCAYEQGGDDGWRADLDGHPKENALGVPLNVTIGTILAEIRPHLPPALRKLPDDRLLTLVNWTLISAFETAIQKVRR
jgi:hypothetical protein